MTNGPGWEEPRRIDPDAVEEDSEVKLRTVVIVLASGVPGATPLADTATAPRLLAIRRGSAAGSIESLIRDGSR